MAHFDLVTIRFIKITDLNRPSKGSRFKEPDELL